MASATISRVRKKACHGDLPVGVPRPVDVPIMPQTPVNCTTTGAIGRPRQPPPWSARPLAPPAAFLQRQQDIRLVRPPAITDTELDRLGVAAAEQMLHVALIAPRKDRNRPDIAPKGPQLPQIALEIAQRYAAVVLDQRRALLQQEFARGREITRMQQIGRAFDQTVGGAKRLDKRHETAFRQATVREIGAEIVERAGSRILVPKADLDALGAALWRTI